MHWCIYALQMYVYRAIRGTCISYYMHADDSCWWWSLFKPSSSTTQDSCVSRGSETHTLQAPRSSSECMYMYTLYYMCCIEHLIRVHEVPPYFQIGTAYIVIRFNHSIQDVPIRHLNQFRISRDYRALNCSIRGIQSLKKNIKSFSFPFSV